MKKVMFLFPSAVGNRLEEDGFLDSFLENDIDYIFKEYSACPVEIAQKYAAALSRYECDAIIHPALDSSFFMWDRAHRDWFAAGTGEAGAVDFLKFLSENGCKLLSIPMTFGSFEDYFELTFYESPDALSKEVCSRLDGI